ncbi:MAG TPA: site-specific integrase, partial [Thermomicrobiales bacterium]|nr:site-specific integrase [Thermomicrobiales bacterium]
GKTEREARRKAKQTLRDYEDGLSRRDERLTVRDYLTDWLETTAANRVRPSTLKNYRFHINNHILPAIGGIQLRELTATDVNRMLAGIVNKGVSPATANLIRATLVNALSSAVKAQMVRSNAAALSDARREKRTRIVPLTPEQARRLIEATKDDRMGPLIAVAIATGLRQGELLALRWQDVDLERRVLDVHRTLTWQKADEGSHRKRTPAFADPKTAHSRRRVPLTQLAVEAFHRQREVVREMEQAATVASWRPIPGEDLVFVTTVGTPLDGTEVTHRLHRLLEGAGLPQKRFHDLRHSTASFLLAEGADIFTVKEILGHSGISMTADIYGHLTEKLAEDAAARLDRVFADAKTGRSAPKPTPDAIDSDDTETGGDR